MNKLYCGLWDQLTYQTHTHSSNFKKKKKGKISVCQYWSPTKKNWKILRYAADWTGFFFFFFASSCCESQLSLPPNTPFIFPKWPPYVVQGLCSILVMKCFPLISQTPWFLYAFKSLGLRVLRLWLYLLCV